MFELIEMHFGVESYSFHTALSSSRIETYNGSSQGTISSEMVFLSCRIWGRGVRLTHSDPVRSSRLLNMPPASTNLEGVCPPMGVFVHVVALQLRTAGSESPANNCGRTEGRPPNFHRATHWISRRRNTNRKCTYVTVKEAGVF
jgi:hypothetical protein